MLLLSCSLHFLSCLLFGAFCASFSLGSKIDHAIASAIRASQADLENGIEVRSRNPRCAPFIQALNRQLHAKQDLERFIEERQQMGQTILADDPEYRRLFQDAIESNGRLFWHSVRFVFPEIEGAVVSNRFMDALILGRRLEEEFSIDSSVTTNTELAYIALARTVVLSTLSNLPLHIEDPVVAERHAQLVP